MIQEQLSRNSDRKLRGLGLFAAAWSALSVAAMPAVAQDLPDTVSADPAQAPVPQGGPPTGDVYAGTAYDGDFLTVGVGAGIGPSYAGSDDYVVKVLPLVQGSYGGIRFNPRAAGVAVDFIPDAPGKTGLELGVAARLRSDRAANIQDDVVASLGKLDRAVEIGPAVGVKMPGVLNPYDSLSVGADVQWDVAGAHGGMVVSPSVTYFTPLSRAFAASLSLSAEWADGDFHDYYFTVTPEQALASGLSQYAAGDGGFTKAGAGLLLAFDVDGDITNGGLGLFAIGSYSRLLGDAADTPFTSERGSRDQLFGGLGVGYTF